MKTQSEKTQTAPTHHKKKKKMPPLKSLAYILSFCMKILPRFSVYVNYIVDPDTFEELL